MQKNKKKSKRAVKTGTKKSQGFKNKTAYKVRYKQDKLDLQKNAVLDRVCHRCYEQLQWKLQFGKYKPIKQPRKCENCRERAILKPYRLLCNKCGDDLKKCTKCMESGPYCSESYQHVPPKVKERINALAENELKKMTLRCRNRVVRMWEDDLIKFHNGQFMYKADEKPLEGIVYKKKFRDDDDDDDIFGDDLFGDGGLAGDAAKVKDGQDGLVGAQEDFEKEIENFVPVSNNSGIKISF